MPTSIVAFAIRCFSPLSILGSGGLLIKAVGFATEDTEGTEEEKTDGGRNTNQH
jgi:hypothetical protein